MSNVTTMVPLYDVVICGGGLAGLLLARQLRREEPELSVAVVERSTRPLPDATHKVGESSVELASQYLERLGLTEYLLDRHLVKLGLRFFPGGGHLPLSERSEVGPCAEPVVRSYQLDRGRLESDLRGFNEADGAHLLEGMRVTGVDLGAGDDDHVVRYRAENGGDDAAERQLRARFVVDAAGRHALLRRKLKQSRGSLHRANAGWFRVEGRIDINDLVPRSDTAWHERPLAPERWRSTNHFMGEGYWVWVIPLGTGNTSIGIVVHDEVHGHECISSYENAMRWLYEHEPQFAAHMEGVPPTDYLCLRNYSHSMGRAWSGERWAMVGEAGAFVDPLYSPGSDFITLANCFTVELIRVIRRGGNGAAKAMQLNGHYRSIFNATIDLFRSAAPVYGHPKAMATKVFWDNFVYWSFTCHFYQQELFRLDADAYQPFVEYGQCFMRHGSHVQLLLRSWAQLDPGVQVKEFIGAPHFPSVLIDAHTKTDKKLSREEHLAYLELRTRQLVEIAGEILLRAVQIVGPEQGRKLLADCKYEEWGLRVAPERLETEALQGHARRIRLSTIARDLERTVGKITPHPLAAAARELLAPLAHS